MYIDILIMSIRVALMVGISHDAHYFVRCTRITFAVVRATYPLIYLDM